MNWSTIEQKSLIFFIFFACAKKNLRKKLRLIHNERERPLNFLWIYSNCNWPIQKQPESWFIIEAMTQNVLTNFSCSHSQKIVVLNFIHRMESIRAYYVQEIHKSRWLGSTHYIRQLDVTQVELYLMQIEHCPILSANWSISAGWVVVLAMNR